jgi:hypothetical protein
MVDLDVSGDVRGEHIRAQIPGFETLAEISGCNIFMDGLQQMDTTLLIRRQAERREIRERETRTADDDPFGKLKQPLRLMPARQIEKAVCANKIEEPRIGHRLVQRGQRLDCVVRPAVRPRSIDVGDGKAWVRTTGQLYHGEPVGKWGWRSLRLQRLMANRGEDNAVQIEYVRGGSGDRDVTVMRWIEAAAEEGYAHRHSLADCACIVQGRWKTKPMLTCLIG